MSSTRSACARERSTSASSRAGSRPSASACSRSVVHPSRLPSSPERRISSSSTSDSGERRTSRPLGLSRATRSATAAPRCFQRESVNPRSRAVASCTRRSFSSSRARRASAGASSPVSGLRLMRSTRCETALAPVMWSLMYVRTSVRSSSSACCATASSRCRRHRDPDVPRAWPHLGSRPVERAGRSYVRRPRRAAGAAARRCPPRVPRGGPARSTGAGGRRSASGT